MRARRFFSVPALLLAGFAAPLAASSPALAVPLFEEATENLGSPQPCDDAKEGCYSHYVLMADLDGDGDLDLAFANGGGYYVANGAAPMAVYLNDGEGVFQEVNATLFGGFTGRVRQVAVGDVDGDGDLDLLAPDSWAMQPDALFINDGQSPPTFVDEGPTRLPVSSRSAGARFGDLDDDGDLDLVLTDWGASPPDSSGTARVYVNDGKGFFTEKPNAVPQNTNVIGTGPIDIDLFDADGDWDLDMVIASRKGESLLFTNDGTGYFLDANVLFPDQPGPYVYGPDECDVDGDGDLDVWLDNGGPGLTEQLLINDGTGAFTDETAMRVSGNPGADDNEVQCVDIDGDGDFDAMIASLSNNERILENDGTGHFTLLPPTFPKVSDSTLGLDLGDVNGDGLIDAVTAQGENGNYLNRIYLGIAPQPADVRAPYFRKVQSFAGPVAPGQVAVHFAVSDASTTDSGPRLRDVSVEIVQVGSSAPVPARFMGGDLFRAVLDAKEGATVTWRACATDWAGNAGCSQDQTFTVEGGAASGSTTAGAGGGGVGGGSPSGSAGDGGAGGGALSGGEAPQADGGDAGDDGGCGCVVVGLRSATPVPLAMAIAASALAAALRRRARIR